MSQNGHQTLVLGGAEDADLRQAVLWALGKIGAVAGDGGWRVGGESVTLSAEQVGLSLTGPEALVEHLARLTDERLAG